jgi:hypothetical protein
MGFTVEEQILAVVVGILATFLANKLGADGSGSGDGIRSDLREIMRIRDDLREAPDEARKIIESAVTMATESVVAKDDKRVKLILDRLTAIEGTIKEDYVAAEETKTPGKEIDPRTVTPADFADVAKSLTLDDTYFVERSFKVAKVARNEDATMLNKVSGFIRTGTTPYAKELWIFSADIGDIWYVVVDTRTGGIVEEDKMRFSTNLNTGDVYTVGGGLSGTATKTIREGFGAVLFTREKPVGYAFANVASTVGTYIPVYDGKDKAPFPYNRWNAFNYVEDMDVKG